MVHITPIKSVADSVNYLRTSVAKSLVDYYAGRGERAGVWAGPTAQRLGLRGDVDLAHLRALLEGYDPHTGADLGRRFARQKVAAFDVTFSAPKSVSILYALGDERIRRAVIEAHEAGAAAAMAYLQEHAAWARRRPMGEAMRLVRASMVMAHFRHRTSRPVTNPETGEITLDPQLHTHIVVPAWVLRPDGTWGSLMSMALYPHSTAAGAVGQAAMRRVLIDRLGVEVTVFPNGCFEVDGIDKQYRDEFSLRSRVINGVIEEWGIDSPEAREMAALETREAKLSLSAGPHLRDHWHRRAAEMGLTARRFAAVVGRRGAPVSYEVNAEAISQAIGEEGLTEKQATFRRRDVVRLIATACPDGATREEIEAQTDRVLASPAVARLRTKDPERPDHPQALEEERLIYSDPDFVALERRMLEQARAAVGTSKVIADPDALSRAITADVAMSAGQQELVQAVCAGSDGVVIVRGVAGSGKTRALRVCRDAFDQSGIRIVGLAHAARAAQTMTEEAGIPGRTIASVIHSSLQHTFAEGSVVIVDEAGMVSSRDLAELVALAADTRSKLVLCGDPAQLQPIGAGAGFRALGDHIGAITLTENVRQIHEWERDALALVREGQIDQAIRLYQDNGRIDVAGSTRERRARVVDTYVDETSAGRDVVVLTHTRREASAINTMARARLVEEGRVSGPKLAIGDTVIQRGDELVCLRNDRRAGLTNGQRGTVTAVNPSEQTIRLLTPSGGVLNIDTDAYPHISHAYALTTHKGQGITADVALVVGATKASREWAYSAMSRGRERTTYFAVDTTINRDPQGEAHIPGTSTTAEREVMNAWRRSDAKDSTLDHMPA